ncbi:DUF6624 domain-containing protein [Streptomyces scopuliridis]|uniref:DUF6624 domain-containing protein n=1 Tax=Streptomyces scopuliridis TaxID=452529 RepID=UPI00398D420A
MFRIDAGNTSWLKQVIAEHGWPGVALVGERGAEEAWLLAQHADLAPAFQRQALELLKAAVTAGDASPRHLAYLTDRVLAAAANSRCRERSTPTTETARTCACSPLPTLTGSMSAAPRWVWSQRRSTTSACAVTDPSGQPQGTRS